MPFALARPVLLAPTHVHSLHPHENAGHADFAMNRHPLNLIQPHRGAALGRPDGHAWGTLEMQSIFDMGPQGQGLWTGSVRMSHCGEEHEQLNFVLGNDVFVSEVRLYGNRQVHARERFPRCISFETEEGEGPRHALSSPPHPPTGNMRRSFHRLRVERRTSMLTLHFWGNFLGQLAGCRNSGVIELLAVEIYGGRLQPCCLANPRPLPSGNAHSNV
jgi:hypothetical protein